MESGVEPGGRGGVRRGGVRGESGGRVELGESGGWSQEGEVRREWSQEGGWSGGKGGVRRRT